MSNFEPLDRRHVLMLLCLAVHLIANLFRVVMQSNEAELLREEQIQMNELRNEVTKLRSAQQSSKVVAGRVEELEALIEQLKSELDTEKKDKERVIADRENIRHEKDEVYLFFSVFNCLVVRAFMNRTSL